MTKYELVEKTEINGEVWYTIRRNGDYVSNSATRELKEAEQMFNEFENGKPSEPIIKTLKTIEVDEDETN